ncbi:Arginase/deacetylase [Serendipita vermifera]|nr:Arginase/deacetylase [Serendipita vermifera]
MESSPRIVAYIVSEELAKVSSLLPSNRGRSLLVHQLVVACGLLRPTLTDDDGNPLPEILVVKPTPATREELATFHDEEYLDYVLNPDHALETDDRKVFGIEDDCPWFKGLHIYVPLVAGATLTAVRLLVEHKANVAICWDGGRHHAQKSQASGFCYVADVVLAILRLKRVSGRPRIMYLDLDLHFSDGVSLPFQNSGTPSGQPRLLTLSIHHASRGFFPSHPLAELTTIDTPDPFSLSIPLHRGASSQTVETIWQSVEKIRQAFDPQYLIIQCGADGLAGDPMGVWNWEVDPSVAGSMGWCVKRAIDWGCKTILLGGGGYHSTNAARAWTALTAIAVERSFPADMLVPEHSLWPRYAPSFTMEVEKGNMSDENRKDYLDGIHETYERLAERIAAARQGA